MLSLIVMHCLDIGSYHQCLPINKVTCTSEYETNCILTILYQLNFSFCSVSICHSTIVEGVRQNGAWVIKDLTFMYTSPFVISFYVLFLFYYQLSYVCIRIRCFPLYKIGGIILSSRSMCVCLKLPALISVS